MERKFTFNTVAEANAFQDGVEWVADSSIRFLRIEDDGLTVVYFDEDATDEEEA